MNWVAVLLCFVPAIIGYILFYLGRAIYRSWSTFVEKTKKESQYYPIKRRYVVRLAFITYILYLCFVGIDLRESERGTCKLLKVVTCIPSVVNKQYFTYALWFFEGIYTLFIMYCISKFYKYMSIQAIFLVTLIHVFWSLPLAIIFDFLGMIFQLLFKSFLELV